MEDTPTKTTVMKDENQMCHDAVSHPPAYGWQPSLLYNQHFGLPPFLDFRDLSWMESVFKKLRSCSWPGYTQAPGFAPLPSVKIHREVGGGVSEVSTQSSRWTVSLDVNHFAPSEIAVRTHGGFLEIEGKHDERQDEHGYISRCFIRKYKVPAGIEAESIRSFITGDGVLTIEAALPSIAPPADVTIPVQVEIEAVDLKDAKQDGSQPGEPEMEDTVIPPPAETPEGDTIGADERIHHPNGLPDAPESVEAGEETITQQVGEEKEEESVDVVDSEGATKEVLDSQPKAAEAPEAPVDAEVQEATHTPEDPHVPEDTQAPDDTQAPEDTNAPEAPDTVTTEMESEIQDKEDDKKIQEAEVEGDLPSAEADAQPPVSEQTQEEIPSKLGVKE